jgi:hypothetical protein
MKRIYKSFSSLLLLSLPLFSNAHPGHGDTDGFSIIHYFTETNHAIALGTILAIAGIIYLYKKSNKESKA